MMILRNYLARFVQDERGVSAIEYSVLGVLIVSAVVAGLNGFGAVLTTAFAAIGTKLAGVG